MQINWHNTPGNEDGFVVQRADDSGFGTNVVTVFRGGSDANVASDTLPTTFKKYYYRVKAVNASGSSGWVASSAKGMTLKSLVFTGSGAEHIRRDSGTNFGTLYSSPQWLAGNLSNANPDPAPTQDFPIAYMSSRGEGSVPVVRVTLAAPKMPTGAHWLVRGEAGVGEDAFSFPQTNLADTSTGAQTEVSAVVTADKPLPDLILDAEMNIIWQISCDGGKTWSGVGSTDNHLYLTGGSADNAYETVIAIGCIGADGLAPGKDDQAIVSGIFSQFTGLDLPHYVAGARAGNAMTYWSNKYSGANPADSTGDYFTTAALLKHSDGRCNAWANIFIDAAKAQSEGNALRFIRVTPNRTQVPRFFNGRMVTGKQWLVVPPAAPVQGRVPNPQNVFNNHAIVLWTAPAVKGQVHQYTLFDPSYGAAFSGGGSDFRIAAGIPWEQGSLASIRIGYAGGVTRDMNLLTPAQNAGNPNCNFT